MSDFDPIANGAILVSGDTKPAASIGGFDPIANGATLVSASSPRPSTSGFDPIANGCHAGIQSECIHAIE